MQPSPAAPAASDDFLNRDRCVQGQSGVILADATVQAAEANERAAVLEKQAAEIVRAVAGRHITAGQRGAFTTTTASLPDQLRGVNTVSSGRLRFR